MSTAAGSNPCVIATEVMSYLYKTNTRLNLLLRAIPHSLSPDMMPDCLGIWAISSRSSCVKNSRPYKCNHARYQIDDPWFDYRNVLLYPIFRGFWAYGDRSPSSSLHTSSKYIKTLLGCNRGVTGRNGRVRPKISWETALTIYWRCEGGFATCSDSDENRRLSSSI